MHLKGRLAEDQESLAGPTGDKESFLSESNQHLAYDADFE
jgi:hypothetical protein